MAGYPIILGGDHATFEIEHANTPPEERPDWPLPSFDAQDWAKAFCKVAKAHGHDLDEGWVTLWFANALMRGYDARQSELNARKMRSPVHCTEQTEDKDDVLKRLDRLESAVLELNPGLNWP